LANRTKHPEVDGAQILIDVEELTSAGSGPRRRFRMAATAHLIVSLAVLLATRSEAVELLRKVSLNNGRVQLFGDTERGSISADGRFVAFIQENPSGVEGVILRDRQLGTSDVIFPPGALDVAISADGRYVAAYGNPPIQVMVYDRNTASTEQWNVNRFDVTFGFSADGRHVAVSTFDQLDLADTNPNPDVYVKDLDTGIVTLASVADDESISNGQSDGPAISADGRYVVFRSNATNLVAGDTNGRPDYFLRDLVAGTTTRVYVATGGGEITDGLPNGPFGNCAISDDGNLIAFTSESAQLVAGDTNGTVDAFVRDVAAGTTTRVSVKSDGSQGLGAASFARISISGNGRFVAFHSTGTLDADTGGGVFVRDLQTNTTTRLRRPLATPPFDHIDAEPEALSTDGRFVVLLNVGGRMTTADTAGLNNDYVLDRASTCGNGTLELDEDCDDGNLVAGDGCEPDCLPTLCLGGVMIDGGFLRRRFGGPLTIKGRLLFPPGMPAVFDPSTTGIQVAVEDVDGADSIYELSSRNEMPIPGGPGCDPVRDGWLVRGGGATQRYLNRSNAIDPPTCTLASAFALKRIRMKDKRLTKGQVTFTLGADQEATPYGPTGPIRVTVVMGGTTADGLAGACATRTFAPSDCDHTGGNVVCR